MTIGLGTGSLFMAKLGLLEGEQGSMEFAVMGPAMTRMAQAEDRAAAGEIFIDEQTCQSIIDWTQAEADGTGFYRFGGFRQDDMPNAAIDTRQDQVIPLLSAPQELDQRGQMLWLLQRIRALELFLPPGLIDKIKLDPERIAIGGEYRPVTVLFANFYGIDEIIQTLGQARGVEITAILNAHFRTMRQIIAKYGGVVNKVDSYAVGHRIMALFGAPRAHIDDPERAVRAALEMQEAMVGFAELCTSCGIFSLKQRIGINTGMVFAGNVGSSTRQEYSVMGDEVNLTARLMAVSAEGRVLISQSTARQTGDRFLLRAQPPVLVKGKSQPVDNYDVLGLQTRQVGHYQPLVGRETEWQIIHDLSERSLAGQTQVLTIVGDVGLGKSKLLQELARHWTQTHDAQSISVTCPSFGRHIPYLPWLDVLRAILNLDPGDSDAVKLTRIERVLCQIDPAWNDWTTLIGSLLGLGAQETELVRALDAQTRQRTLFHVICGLVAHVAGERPLLLSIDDLQSADDASVDLVNYVARQLREDSLLIALTYRPDESLSLDVDELGYTTVLSLRELDESSSLHLLDILLPTTPQMPDRLRQIILDKARGNPLYIDAMAHSLIENYLEMDPDSGTYRARADLDQIEVPDSVNRVIMSRIDRLDESSRNVLRVASAIGQEFEKWLLTAIYPYRRAEGELDDRLSDLAQREILSNPQADLLYLFRHVLTREVAYESLLYADRRQLHRRIGESIETQQADQISEYNEVLAYHFSLAEVWDKAWVYHLRAGRKAQQNYANEDAIHHFEQAIRALEHISDDKAGLLEAHTRLVEVLETVAEYDRALAHNAQARALVAQSSLAPLEAAQQRGALCRQAASIYEKRSDYEHAFSWLQNGLDALGALNVIEKAEIYLLGAGLYYRQGKYDQAIAWCRQSLDIADQSGRADKRQVIAHAYNLMGQIYTRRGDMGRAIEFCQQSLALYEEIQDVDKAAGAHINLGNGYFAQSDWSNAATHYLRALEIKRKIGDVYHQAVVTLNLGGVYLNRGELDQADHYHQASLEMWETLGSAYAIALVYNNMAAVALRRNALSEAQRLLGKSEALFQELGSTDFLPEVYRHLSEVYLGQNNLDQALEYARRSLDLACEHEMRLEEGITRSVLGRIHIAASALDQAAHELETSLEILESLQSRYEIGQALVQLTRLYRQLGQPGKAERLLDRALSIFQALGAYFDLVQAQSLKSSGSHS